MRYQANYQAWKYAFALLVFLMASIAQGSNYERNPPSSVKAFSYEDEVRYQEIASLYNPLQSYPEDTLMIMLSSALPELVALGTGYLVRFYADVLPRFSLQSEGLYDISMLFIHMADSLSAYESATLQLMFDQQFTAQQQAFEEQFATQESTIDVLSHRLKIAHVLFFAIIAGLLLSIGLVLFFLLKQLHEYKSSLSIAREKFNQQNKALTKIMDEDEREKVVIANELHAGMGKILAQIRMQLYLIEDFLKRDDQQLLTDTIDLVELAESKTQSLSRYLVAGELIHTGLIPAIESYLQYLKGAKSLKVTFLYDEYVIQPPLEMEVSLYKIAQQLVAQALKNKGVSRLEISILSNGTHIRLEVKYDGPSVSVSDLENADESAWLHLQNRVQMLRGEIKIKQDTIKGNNIEVALVS